MNAGTHPSDHYMEVDASASCIPMSADYCRPRHRQKQKRLAEICHKSLKEHSPHSEDYFPNKTSTSADCDLETDHLYVLDCKLVVATGQILKGVDLDTFTMKMVHRALMQKFPSLELLELDERMQFIQHAVLNIIDPIAPQSV